MVEITISIFVACYFIWPVQPIFPSDSQVIFYGIF